MIYSKLGLPQKPSFLSKDSSPLVKTFKIISSWLFSLIIALLAWFFPNPDIRLICKILLATIIILIIFYVIYFFISLFKYFGNLELIIKNIVFKILLSDSKIQNVADLNKLRFDIKSIKEKDGGVLIVYEDNMSCTIDGSILDMIFTATDEKWGTLVTTDSSGPLRTAKPINRIRPEFWENLEDRMKIDPTPPQGFHLEPFINNDLKTKLLNFNK